MEAPTNLKTIGGSAQAKADTQTMAKDTLMYYMYTVAAKQTDQIYLANYGDGHTYLNLLKMPEI